MQTTEPINPPEDQDTPQGLAFALTAYLLWGVLPLYMKLLAHIPPAEVVVHRVLWSVPIAALVLILLKRTADLRQALRTPSMLLMGCVTAALVSVNWGIYVWAIASDRALDAALGYYINPLFSIFLAAVFLKERMNTAQLVAVTLAAAAVLILTLEAGEVPWVALALTVSWGFYALSKKSLPIGPNQAFMLEVLILTPPALAYLAYLTLNGQSHFSTELDYNTWLLLGCGLATAIPLLSYANGAKRLRLSTIGILQYTVPTMIFLIAVFVFEEPLGRARMIAFPLIWAALILYTVSMLRGMRRVS